MLRICYIPLCLLLLVIVGTGQTRPGGGSPGRAVGVVKETFDSGGYTYVSIDKDGKELWAAAPKTAIKTGEEVTFSTGMPMQNFFSPSLNRRFEVIYFVSSPKAGAGPVDANPLPKGHPTIDPSKGAGGASMAGAWTRGRVVETMDSGNYTYVQVNTKENKKVWAAGPKTPVKAGEWIQFPEGMVNDGFESPTLKRSFDKIHFVGQLQPMGLPPSAAPELEAPADVTLPEGDPVELAALIKDSEKWAGNPVVVRGRVTKYNANIMKRNWVHLTNPTGDGKDDLTVTTLSKVSVGDVVTAGGRLVRNKDVGSGYVFDVLLEDAVLVKE